MTDCGGGDSGGCDGGHGGGDAGGPILYGGGPDVEGASSGKSSGIVHILGWLAFVMLAFMVGYVFGNHEGFRRWEAASTAYHQDQEARIAAHCHPTNWSCDGQ